MLSLPANILEQTPEDMARTSLAAQAAYEFVSGQIAGIIDDKIREKLLVMYEYPRPCLPEQMPRRKKLFCKLRDSGMLDVGLTFDEFVPKTIHRKKPPPVWAASGSHYRGHNAHPGGLLIHTEKNLRFALTAAEMHEAAYGLPADRDMLIFAQVAHDLAKTWLLPWQEDGACLPQYQIAGAGAHHVFGLAESIHQGFPPVLIFSQAATHVDPCTGEGYAEICGFLRAACLIAGADPVSYGFWDKRGQPEFDHYAREHWFNYMADRMVVFTLRAGRRAVKLLKKLAEETYGFSKQELDGKPFNQFRNYLFCQIGTAGILRALSLGGTALLAQEVQLCLAKANKQRKEESHLCKPQSKKK